MFLILSSLLAFVAGLFQSRASLCLERLALRHQLAVYQRAVPRVLSQISILGQNPKIWYQ